VKPGKTLEPSGRARKRTPPAEISLSDAVSPSGEGGIPQVVLKPHEDRRVRRGHLWIFSNEIASAPADLEPGAVVRFVTARGDLLGSGFYHPRSLIAGRLLDREDVRPDAAFFEGRLRAAMELRRRLFSDDAWRWIHGESDDLPGLVVDRYGDAVVVESFCAGMDLCLDPLLAAIKSLGEWRAIVVKNDAGLRRLEGLADRVDVVHGTLDRPHWFTVDGLRLASDLLEGQKTGFFFDQRVNRRATAALSRDARVLDVFCHSGGFGLAAAAAGAKSVVGVDESEPALDLARAAARENGFAEKTRFERGDAFEFLAADKETYDVVVVDPPKFAPSKKHLPRAIEAYIRLNALAMRRVSGGGFLATASCSQHVDRETFRQILSRASQTAGRRARVIQWGGASPDHPVRLAMPETEYLKFALVHIA